MDPRLREDDTIRYYLVQKFFSLMAMGRGPPIVAFTYRSRSLQYKMRSIPQLLGQSAKLHFETHSI
jgi:hypothetical protein